MLIPDLALVALPILLQVKGPLRYMMLYMPAVAWIALICGGFAGKWTLLRTGLILRTIRRPASPQTFLARPDPNQSGGYPDE